MEEKELKHKVEVIRTALENKYRITTGGKVYWILDISGDGDILIGDVNEQFTINSRFLGRTFWILSKRMGILNRILSLFTSLDVLKLRFRFSDPKFFREESWRKCRDYSSVQTIKLLGQTDVYQDNLMLPNYQLHTSQCERWRVKHITKEMSIVPEGDFQLAKITELLSFEHPYVDGQLVIRPILPTKLDLGKNKSPNGFICKSWEEIKFNGLTAEVLYPLGRGKYKLVYITSGDRYLNGYLFRTESEVSDIKGNFKELNTATNEGRPRGMFVFSYAACDLSGSVNRPEMAGEYNLKFDSGALLEFQSIFPVGGTMWHK